MLLYDRMEYGVLQMVANLRCIKQQKCFLLFINLICSAELSATSTAFNNYRKLPTDQSIPTNTQHFMKQICNNRQQLTLSLVLISTGFLMFRTTTEKSTTTISEYLLIYMYMYSYQNKFIVVHFLLLHLKRQAYQQFNKLKGKNE